MQSSYKIKFTPIAEDDLDVIYRYISEHLIASKAATDLMDSIETSIAALYDAAEEFVVYLCDQGKKGVRFGRGKEGRGHCRIEQ